LLEDVKIEKISTFYLQISYLLSLCVIVTALSDMRLFLVSGHVITKRSDVLIGLPSIGNVGQVYIMIIIDGNIR